VLANVLLLQLNYFRIVIRSKQASVFRKNLGPMLTAQKQHNPLEAKLLRQRPPTIQSIDKVVNSIEGLRDRLQGFSLEQVSEAHQRLRTMSLGLGELQRTLEALAQIKQQMGRLQKTVQQAEAESLETSRLTTVDEPMPAHAIAQVGNLLKFRRVIKLMKAAKSVSAGLVPQEAHPGMLVRQKSLGIVPENEPTVIDVNEVPDESEPVLQSVRAETNVELVLPKLVETASEPPPNEQALTADSLAIEHELPERLENETPADVTSEDLEQPEAIFHSAPAEMDFEPNEPFSSEPTDIIFFDDSTTSLQQREIIAEFADTRAEPSPNHDAIFDEFKGTEDMEVNPAIPEIETAETTDQTHTTASEEADFDQRLLDDLIKDYGEFTILPRSPAKSEAEKKAQHENTIASRGPDSSIAVELASQRNLPLQRKDGELDRKLKKLMKDYGEYDLYSRPTPISLKTAVVAAFLLLTLVFSGFYFFSSSKSAVPSSTLSAPQSQNSPDSGSKETSTITETSGGKIPPASSVSNAGVPKTAEAAKSHNIENKVETNKPN
jgi:hypothetical protein